MHKNVHHVTHALAYHLETLYISAFALVMAVAFLWNPIFANTSSNLKANDTVIYPLQKVTTFACRQLMKPWDELPESCKVDLPIIKNANYEAYINDNEYKNIYTTLRGGSYRDQWDMDKGDHAGIDIATANGTPLYAVAHGVVTFAWTQAWYGNVVKLMFSYKGVTYHAVYAHMKSISVTKGDLVTQGQKVGEVGNTGSVSGALWGNHVHFEIAKDNAGRPAYYYQWCPALATNSLTQITNGGLCREYRQQYAYDPIAFIEKAKKNNVVIADAHPSAWEQPTIEKPLPEVQPDIAIDPTALSKRFLTLRSIPASKLTKDAIDFLRDWDIQIVAHTSTLMNVGQEGTLTFYITKKTTKKPFDGILPAAFSFISANGGISVSQSSVQYVKNGEHTITFTPKIPGSSSLAISIGGQTISVMTIAIQ